MLLLALAMSARAYDFSSLSSSGQTLYYNISGASATVTFPGTQAEPYPSTYSRPTGALVIPDSVTNGGITYLVTAIDSHAFDSCTGLTSVTIPASVNSIGSYAFYRCNGLTSISLPDAVTEIDEFTFYGCTTLVDVEFPDSLTSIGVRAFSNCYHIDTLAFPNSLLTIGDFAFSYSEAITDLIIPNSVTSIGNSAFFGNRRLANVTIGSAITSLGYSVFSDCYQLERVNILAPLTAIPDAFFLYCSALDSIVIPSTVTSIGQNAFAYCSSLQEVTIPEAVRTIGNNAFTQCQNLTTVNFNAERCTSMGTGATEMGYTSVFSGCVNFVTLNIGSGVTNLPENAFARCVMLTTVNFDATNCTYMGTDSTSAFTDCNHFNDLNIGEGVETLPNNAFARCLGLPRITIPSTVSRIGSKAFFQCRNIREITALPSTPPTIDSNTFTGFSYSVPLLVNCGDGQLYLATDIWDQFRNLQEFNGFTITLETEDLNKGTVSIVQAPDCVLSRAIIQAIPNDRYAFDHWQDGDTTNPRTVLVDSDTAFIAYFIYTGHSDPEGIDESEATNVAIATVNGAIVLSGAENEDLTIVDMMGRVVVHEIAVDGKSYSMPSAGVYLVRLGKHVATKVVVTR